MKIVWLLLAYFLSFTVAETYCNSTSQCPESEPCCSQYGVCGTGAYCLGGCDIRYSYNLSSCMPMPRMGSFTTNFTSTDQLELQTKYLGNYSETDWVYTGYIDTHNDALLLQMPNQTSGTVVSSTTYLWYGKITAKLKTSHDKGVVTAFIMFSDVQDEIDWEFVGYNLTAGESNYYALGITDYNNSVEEVTTNTFKNYHEYEIDWQEDEIAWYIDGEHFRTLKRKDTWNSTTKRYDFPQTPSRIQFSLWPGGASSNAEGTIEWAGGSIDWDSDDIKNYGYYYSYLESVKVEAYDLPDDVELEGDDDESKLHAFLFNNTRGWGDNVYLTNKTTWLGSDDATGFDPDNESDSDSDDTTTVVNGSGSHKSTATKTKSKTANVPTLKTTSTTDQSYDTSNAIGGFVQNSQQSSTKSSSNTGASVEVSGFIGFIMTIMAGVVAFFV